MSATQPVIVCPTNWTNEGHPAGFGGEYAWISGLKYGRILIQASQAEADLIAAAPELLAIAKGFRWKLHTYVSVYPGDKELRKLLKDCDEAIAKATGRPA